MDKTFFAKDSGGNYRDYSLRDIATPESDTPITVQSQITNLLVLLMKKNLLSPEEVFELTGHDNQLFEYDNQP